MGSISGGLGDAMIETILALCQGEVALDLLAENLANCPFHKLGRDHFYVSLRCSSN